MRKFWYPFLILLVLSAAASAKSGVVGIFGPNGTFSGFDGRMPIVGGIGYGSSPPPSSCTGTVDATEGCPLPMIGS